MISRSAVAPLPVTDATPEERAWGFTQTQYIIAFSRILSITRAERYAAQLFTELRRDPQSSIERNDSLFALLSLVSAEARQRIQRIRGWDIEDLRERQARVLRDGLVDDEVGGR